MKIYFASDHAGFELKAVLMAYLTELGYAVIDMGAPTLAPEDDYPDYIAPCAERVAAECRDVVRPDMSGRTTSRMDGVCGIIIGGSGQGEAMVANRVKGARAAVYYGPAERSQTDADDAMLDIITSSRAHNDANILALGARFIDAEEAKRVVKQFLETVFSGEARHVRRIAKF